MLRKERSEATGLKHQMSDYCPGQQKDHTTAYHNYQQPPVMKHALSTPNAIVLFCTVQFQEPFSRADVNGSAAWRTSRKEQHRKNLIPHQCEGSGDPAPFSLASMILLYQGSPCAQRTQQHAKLQCGGAKVQADYKHWSSDSRQTSARRVLPINHRCFLFTVS